VIAHGLQPRGSGFTLSAAVRPKKSPNRSGSSWSARSQGLAPFDLLSRGGGRIRPGQSQRRSALRCDRRMARRDGTMPCY
jgi:hypothetical protein